MLNRRSRRSGFTLPEVLVTVAIIAVLAAAVVPAVTQQISKGDQGQFTGSVDGIQLGITSFVTDVHKFPIALSQLANQPAVDDSTLVPLGHLTAADSSQWKGPYVQTSIAAGDSVSVGFGLRLLDTLVTRSNFIIAMIDGDSASIVRADDAVDAGDGNAAGRIRWTLTGPGLDSAWVQLLTAR